MLDVCVSAGDIWRARQLVQEMRKFGSPDLVTYNTLLKGYCQKGDLQAAKQLVAEFAREGLQPNDVSFNCLFNTAVGAGNFGEAWALTDSMEQHGVKADQYTMSILLKIAKRSQFTGCLTGLGACRPCRR